MVDIVVTYLNERDKQWQKDFEYWKEKEIKEGKQEATNRQAFGKERAREWDCFKYWFRGIENNCPWIDRVFLVVQNENHVPKWIDKNNPKLRIVYHEEYMPKDLLPNFNAMAIAMYISNIKDLSENYIMSDDDYYFLNPIPKERFFKYGKPVHPDNILPYELYGNGNPQGTDHVFFRILNNNIKFEEKFSPNKVKYGIYHLPEARSKSFEQKILKEYGEEIKQHQIVSKFRNKNNLCPYMFSDLLKICSKATLGRPYKKSCYCTLKSNIDFNYYKDKEIVCFNDTEQLDDYEKTKEKLIDFLDSKFPNKSSFEKEMI
ncbi:MAG: hypothetical protein J6S85_04310 [Methanobrevibacter sp.]|nr:hypothetical protein [Methanobrevibacter sp.]